ncbi:hormogonium polysaccharide biosynthesis glycosyltransferase HpsE [Leptothoe spongobia]|uniref:Glycosyltransferase family 2 protein n=1 Tax=Leptothoe spongobia TAU-MAC 1115 TaxID=1967444 RepID=A0A947DFD7_9CYAN|nr:hormogonium polysaccharide biosynthesis glycosyltransferase HpsE [Leptothoe spongobia]MBT9315558.1 glycosyltransferase family 2 protein [Leptothoe spongobia TAU-MAC 1115]
MQTHQSPVRLSVVVPTYNGAERIPEVLDRLSHQQVDDAISWNIVVVDNNSSDRTAEIVRKYQRDWSEKSSLNYVFEQQQGLAYARQCGVDHSDGALIAFLDDDNWPPLDWVNQIVAFAQQYPRAGAFGGRISGSFESEIPEDVEPLLGFLAIRDRGDTPHRYPVEQLQFPPGAGLVVRRVAWEQCIPPVLIRSQRGGNDSEISWRMAKADWEIWYNPYTTIEHFIPQSRLERAYLKAITHTYGVCTCELLMIETAYWQRPAILFKSALGSLKRIIKHFIKYRHRSISTIEADCLLSFYMGNLKSPFFYLFKSLYRQAA